VRASREGAYEFGFRNSKSRKYYRRALRDVRNRGNETAFAFLLVVARSYFRGAAASAYRGAACMLGERTNMAVTSAGRASMAAVRLVSEGHGVAHRASCWRCS